MEIIDLPKIRISVVAPPHSGKTTLITLLYEYMQAIQATEGSFEVSCTKNKRQLDEYLSYILENKELPKSWINGFEFEFGFSIKTSNKTIRQKIVFFDADGDIINSWNGGSGVYEDGKPALQKFRKHLQESQILLMLVDMPVIIEDDSPHFIKSCKALGYNNIKAIAQEWRNHRNESDEYFYAHFVMTNCETYYCQESACVKECEDKVNCYFKDILNSLNKAQNISVYFTPVYIAGYKSFNKGLSHWNKDGSYQKVFDNNTYRLKPYGINDIWNTIFDHISHNMSKYLKKELSTKSFVSFGNDETKEIAVKAIDFFMKIIELKTENINDNFNYNKILKPRWIQKNT